MLLQCAKVEKKNETYKFLSAFCINKINFWEDKD